MGSLHDTSRFQWTEMTILVWSSSEKNGVTAVEPGTVRLHRDSSRWSHDWVYCCHPPHPGKGFSFGDLRLHLVSSNRMTWAPSSMNPTDVSTIVHWHKRLLHCLFLVVNVLSTGVLSAGTERGEGRKRGQWLLGGRQQDHGKTMCEGAEAAEILGARQRPPGSACALRVLWVLFLYF